MLTVDILILQKCSFGSFSTVIKINFEFGHVHVDVVRIGSFNVCFLSIKDDPGNRSKNLLQKIKRMHKTFSNRGKIILYVKMADGLADEFFVEIYDTN